MTTTNTLSKFFRDVVIASVPVLVDRGLNKFLEWRKNREEEVKEAVEKAKPIMIEMTKSEVVSHPKVEIIDAEEVPFDIDIEVVAE